MKIVLIVVGIAVAVIFISIVIVLVIGSLLPPNHFASRSVRLKPQLHEVYALVRDFGASPAWRADVKSVEMLDRSEDGLIRFRENGSHGSVTYELVGEEPDRRIVTRIVDRDLGYSGSWTYEFVPTDTGTTVTITENGEVSNILFRFMSRYIFGHTATIDAYLKALGKRLGEY